MALNFHYSFSFRNTNKSVAFYKDNTVIFAAGKLCILMDLDTGIQKSFFFSEPSEVTAIVRCGIFVAGAIKGCPPSACLFNTLSETTKIYKGPTSMKCKEFTCLSVSVNLKFFAAQGGHPDWLLIIWLSQTREIVTVLNPAAETGASVHEISFHASGRDELVVVGENVFKLYEQQEEAEEDNITFEEIVFEKFQKSGCYYTIAWPEKEYLAVGSSSGRILFFRGIEFISEIDLECDIKQHVSSENVKGNGNDKAVTSIVVTSQQLLCIFAGYMVLIYDGEEITQFVLTKLIFLQTNESTKKIPGELEEAPDSLVSLIASSDERDLIATTRNGQLLRCPDFAKQQKPHFIAVLQRQHNDPIIDIDTSQGRPLIASCSQRALIIWNYQYKKQEIRKYFKDNINSVALHPTGLYVALSFANYSRVFSILHDNLRERVLITCRHCARIRFSTGGHLLAIVSDSIIEIYSFISHELLFKLNGHAGFVTCFDWIENDSKLVSCDTRGIICMWDLESPEKIYEITALVSYLFVSVNPTDGSFIAVGTNKSVRCYDNKSSLKWILESKKELLNGIFCPDGQTFYLGTADGSVEFCKHPCSDETASISAHAGNISEIIQNFAKDLLISSGSDGCIFLWRTTQDNDIHAIFSELCLVDNDNLSDQNNKSKQLQLCLQHIDTSNDSEYELNKVKYEETIKNMALNHDKKVDELNKMIVQVKEEIQNILFDSDPEIDRKELETKVRKEIIDTTFKLDEAYKKSNTYAIETNKIIVDYEKKIVELADKHAKFSCTESQTIENITEKIKSLENTLLSEKEISNQELLQSEANKKKAEREMMEAADTLKTSQVVLLEEEKSKAIELQKETKKLKQMIEFQVQDNKLRRNITTGQIDKGIKEKSDAISVLERDFQTLEEVLKTKEKNCQKQEKKFCEMRKLVESTNKQHSVTKTAYEELNEKIKFKQTKILSCQESIEEVTSDIPKLEDEIKNVEDVCLTVQEKLKETVHGYKKKQNMFRDTQDVLSKYRSKLQSILAKDCDPIKLRSDILCLFEESKTGSEDERIDPELQNELDFQIDKLKTSYDQIKDEPSKAMADKAMAEFRLCQENSKILKEVHIAQKEAEKLRLIINDMETALGLQAAKARSNKMADELRNKIEFVIEASKKNREERLQEIAKLDLLIEEQQNEIERFQTMLADKEK